MAFDNVYLGSPEMPLHEMCEQKYLTGIFHELQHVMGYSFFDFNFVIYSGDGSRFKKPLQPKNNDLPCVLLYLTDETSSVPKHLSEEYHAIFKNYLPYDQYDNIFSLPLGYVKNVPENPYKRVNERKYSIFFSGRLNYYRMSFYTQFLGSHPVINSSLTKPFIYTAKRFLPYSFPDKHPESFIVFTNGFRQGMNGEEYSSMLSDSKIALCPRGFISPETFRHFEAMRAGCVIISEPLPQTYFYENSPIITLNKWTELDGILRTLRNNPGLVEEKSLDMYNWWQRKCSERSVAEYIANVITTLPVSASKAHRYMYSAA